MWLDIFRPSPDISKVGIPLVGKSVGIWDCIVNPIYKHRVRMTPGINPIYAGLGRSCPRDSKNVSYVDVGLV